MAWAEKTRGATETSHPTPDEFEALFRVLREGVVLFDLNRRFVQVNGAFLEMTGYSMEELRKMDYTQITPAEFAELDQKQFNETLELGGSGPFRKQYQKKSGERLWVEITGALTESSQGTKRIWTLIKNIDIEQQQSVQLRKQNSQLEEYLSLLQGTIESTADGVLVVDLNESVRLFNRKFSELWRLRKEILDSKDESKMLASAMNQLKFPQNFLEKITELYSMPEIESFDVLEFKDGRVFERYSQPQRLGNKVVGRVWSFRDITDRKRIERTLQDSEERFKSLSESTFEGIIIHDHGKVLLVNQSASKQFGYDPMELVGKDVLHLVAPEWRETVLKNVLRGNEGPYEAMNVRKDGTKFWVEIRARSIFYRGISARIASILDITDRKIIEEKLMQREEDFRASFEMAAVGAGMTDPHTGRFTRVNQKLCQLTGYTADELIGMNVMSLTHSSERAQEYDLWSEMLSGKRNSYTSEKQNIKKDGSIIWVKVHAASIRDRTGKVLSTLSQIEDVTERKKAELERDFLLNLERQNREDVTFLAEASDKLASSLDYDSILNSISMLITPKLADFLCLRLSENGDARLLVSCIDSSKKDAINQLKEELQENTNFPRFDQAVLYEHVTRQQLYPDSTVPILGTKDPHILEIVRSIGIKSLIAFPLTIRNRVVGSILFASTRAGHTYSNRDFKLANNFARICSNSIDKAILYQNAQRSITVRDDFIAIASHELRTPLTPLKMQIQLLRKYTLAPEKLSPSQLESIKGMLVDSERQIERLESLVENLLDVSRISANRLELSPEKNVDFGKLVCVTIDRFSAELEAAQCPVSFTSESEVRGNFDRKRVMQVINNLLSNAIKFGPGKPIEIHVAKVRTNAELTITDHGTGIDPKYLSKLFGRFGRLAPLRTFGGLGLGLYISRKIIEKMGGSISVTSSPSQGSTFKVTLPTI